MEVLFSGHVQGVGFRFTAERLARHFEVAGFVRNLPEGGVELVAEGDEAVLKDFLAAVRESEMKSYIQDVHVRWTGAQGRFQGFGVAV